MFIKVTLHGYGCMFFFTTIETGAGVVQIEEKIAHET